MQIEYLITKFLSPVAGPANLICLAVLGARLHALGPWERRWRGREEEKFTRGGPHELLWQPIQQAV